MIWNMWLEISYTVQLLAACLLLMLAGRKRNYFWLRTGGSGAFFIIITFVVNNCVEIDSSQIYTIFYFAIFIFIAIAYVYIGLDCSIEHATYYAVCACAAQHIAYDIYRICNMTVGNIIVLDIMIYLIIYTIFYQFFVKKIVGEIFSFNVKNTIFPIVTIVSLVWILSIMEETDGVLFMAGAGQRIIYRVIDSLCCFYVLWVQVNQKKNYMLQHEIEAMDYILQQQKLQYEITSETIGNINRKCHDLKYQIRTLRHITDEKEKENFFDELEKDIIIYDTVIKTGNQAVDVVLMEKGMFCKEHNIQWTCMADGFQLKFIKNEDIYTIFGNALDNAINAVMELENLDKRIISLKMIRQNEILIIQIQNYFHQQLNFNGGIPVTTKNDRNLHGYGLKSIKYTAEKYDGTITINTENDIFTLQILLPIRNSEEIDIPIES